MADKNHGLFRSISTTALMVAAYFGASAMASATCLPPESQLPASQVQSFLSNPSGLLASNPTGGGNMIVSVKGLVSSNNDTLPALIQLLSSANPQQRAAIGSGLASAIPQCLTGDHEFAGKIQTSLVETNDRIALTAFVSGGGQETNTAAIGDAPAQTAYVSGFGQVTGTNTSAPIVQSLTSGAGRNFAFPSTTPASGSSTSRPNQSDIGPGTHVSP